MTTEESRKIDWNSFRDISNECDTIKEFIEEADEGTSFKENDIIYYKYREGDDYYYTIYFDENDNIVTL